MGRTWRQAHDSEKPCLVVIEQTDLPSCPSDRLHGLALPSDPLRRLMLRSDPEMILAVLYSDFLKDDSRVEEIHAEPVFS